MAFPIRAFSKGQIDKAGLVLLLPFPNVDEIFQALNVINNWRSCHSYPLQIIKMTLLKRAKKITRQALIAQRLKRLPSIELKLLHNPNMKLSQMQDIGGCRAVLDTVSQVKKLVDVYEKTKARNPEGRPVWVDKYDYISYPKPDGYRSIHLIYKYNSVVKEKQPFNGQRIEIQIRSTLQHTWATAVEIAQTFTGQALKSKIKHASASWLRFFALMGTAIALREKSPPVPGTPTDRDELVAELRELEKKERIIQQLSAWGGAVQLLQSHPSHAHTFLLILDPVAMTLIVRPFQKDKMPEAQEEYLAEEKNLGKDSQKQVVLVAVESLDALRKAYPNYWADTGAFISAVRAEIEPAKAERAKKPKA